MNDPQRLLEGGTKVERTLLNAGKQEEPSHRAMRNAAAAIGLGAAAGLSAHAAGAGTATVVVHVAEALKWVGAGILGVGVVAAVGYAVVNQNSEPPPSSPVAQPVVIVPLQQEETRPPPQQDPPSEKVPEAKPKSPVVASVKPAPKTSSGGSLKDQVALVDEARKSLGAGQPQAALSTLNRYQREYPKGALGQEAMLLRIEALAQMGNRSAARALATRFLSRQPTSPHRKRIESLVGKIDLPD